MSTTESIESIQSIEAVSLEVVMASLKSFATADLFKLSKASMAEAEKRVKSGKLTPKVKKEKKPTPPQLIKPKEWVNWVLKHAQAHGWAAFSVENKKAQEIIEMPASIQVDGAHVFPDGKKMTLTHAMSLSKKYWTAKEQTGIHKELYDQFEAEYTASLTPASEAVVEPAVVPVEEKAAVSAKKKPAKKASKKVASDEE
jgi:hypothetical protein